MSITTFSPPGRGTAITIGLLPKVGPTAPHAGTLGSVFVQHMANSPWSAACQPYVPPRIQWLVCARKTAPIPFVRASWIARCMDDQAFRLPGPRLPSQRSIERWDGNLGPGNLNAWSSMQRAIQLARTNGIGAVFLAHTNHWMRGGTYGWQAADQGLFAMCWTNTLPNVPAWGAVGPTFGNNPMVMAVPRPGGENVVIDMAMSQYSYGTLSAYANRGQPLPFPG